MPANPSLEEKKGGAHGRRLLAEVDSARAEKRPYVIVFVGVNGVGKSTSLSKVAVRARRRPDRAPAAASFV